MVIGAILGTVFTIAGSVGQLISLNFWLQSFPNGAGPFTVLTLVATTVAFLCGAVLAVWIAVRMPKLRFALGPDSLVLGFFCGLCYALNGVLLVFATPATPELLQALLLSTGIFWTFAAAGIAEVAQNGFTSFKRMDRRAILVPVAFFLCTAGVIVAAGSFKFTSMSSEARKWTIIFAISMVPAAISYVLFGVYMDRFTLQDDVVVTLMPSVGSTLSFHEEGHHFTRKAKFRSDPTTVKFVIMTMSSVFQAVLLFVMFPLDWTPGYGGSANAHEAAHSLSENYKCVFFGPKCSSDNFAYYVAFALSYAGSLGGNTLLNQISPPMCSMVTQLATPAGALLLIAVPSWNVTGQEYHLGAAIGALVLLTAGSTLYVFWARFLQPATADCSAEADALLTGDDEVNEGTVNVAVC